MRGVQDVEVFESTCEAVVTRRAGQARDSELLQALVRCGYPGRLLPIEVARLRIDGLGEESGARRVFGALKRVRGVKRIEILGTRIAVITLDRRYAAPADLLVALEGAGVTARLEG